MFFYYFFINILCLYSFSSSQFSSASSLVQPKSIQNQPLVLSAPPRKTRVAKVNAMSQLHYPILLHWFRSHPSPPIAIISDYFLGWTHHLACELSVRRLVFSPSSAFGFSVLLSLWRDLPKLEMGSPLSFPQIPHSPVFPWRQIHSHRPFRQHCHFDQKRVRESQDHRPSPPCRRSLC
jgi:hypothetical protein